MKNFLIHLYEATAPSEKFLIFILAVLAAATGIYIGLGGPIAISAAILLWLALRYGEMGEFDDYTNSMDVILDGLAMNPRVAEDVAREMVDASHSVEPDSSWGEVASVGLQSLDRQQSYGY